jgi:hypothetical protein
MMQPEYAPALAPMLTRPLEAENSRRQEQR